MRIIQLTESEAANSAVMANVAQYLMGAPGADVTHFSNGLHEQQFSRAESRAALKADIMARFEPLQAAQEQRNVADTKIAAADRPDAGFPPDASAAAPRPDPSNPATIGFGTNPQLETYALAALQPAMVLPFPGATVPVAANLVNPNVPDVNAAAQGYMPPVAPNLPLPPVAPPATGAADLDSKGLPWDPRIHSAGDNKKNADGSWRKKRGVPDTLVTEVEAELRQIMAIPALAQAPVAAPVIPLPPIPAAPVPAAPAPVAAAPTLAQAQAVITFSTWMEELTPALNRQLITQELFSQLTKNAHGPATDMNALVMRPELIPPVRHAMKEWLDANHPGWANAAA